MAEAEAPSGGSENSPAAPAAGATPPAGGASNAPPSPNRPEGLPDSYWDGEKNEVKFGELTGRLSELETFRAERDLLLQGVPEKPDGYKIELPGDFQAPEGVDLQLDDKNPVVGPAREWAHKWKIPQDAFNELVAVQAQGTIAQQKALADAVKAERTSLGPQATERLDALSRVLEAQIGKEAATALYPALFTASAVKAMERLLTKVSGRSPLQFQPQRDGARESKGADWDSLSADEKFERARRNNQSRQAERV